MSLLVLFSVLGFQPTSNDPSSCFRISYMMLHSRISAIIRSSSSHRPEQAATVSQGVATGMVYSHDSQSGGVGTFMVYSHDSQGVWVRSWSIHTTVRGVATCTVYSHESQSGVWLRAWSIHTTVRGVATCMVNSHDSLSGGCSYVHGLFTRQSVS